MKWYEYIIVIAAFGGLTQFVSWILESLGLKEVLGQELIVFLSALFSFIIIFILLIIEIQKDIEQIKTYLKKQGYDDNSKSKFDILVDDMKNKKGQIDAKVLLIIVILVILYLLYKVGVFNLS